MSCDVGGHIGFSFTREHRQNGERQGEARGLDRTRRHIFPGKTGKYLYYRLAAWRTLMVESVNLL